MNGLAAFIMRSRLHAIAVVTGASVLPLLAWLGGAALGLVALRRGPVEGSLVAALSLALLAIWTQLAFGSPVAALQPALEFWLPVLALAAWLRRSVSLASTLRLAAGMAALLVLGLHLAYPDQAAYWAPVLDAYGEIIGQGSPQALESWQQLRGRLEPVMTGLWALSLMMVALLTLFLARWLQARLYNPGGFRREFHALNLGRVAALPAVLALGLAGFNGAGLWADLAVVVGAVFVFQALAFCHAAVAARGLSTGWLVGAYLLLPALFELFMVFGIADAAFDWRRRLLKDAGRDGPV